MPEASVQAATLEPGFWANDLRPHSTLYYLVSMRPRDVLVRADVPDRCTDNNDAKTL